MVQCPACRIPYVTNTVFCPECGLYLLEDEQISTDPLEAETPAWEPGAASKPSSSGTGLLSIRLRIRTLGSSEVPPTSPSSFRLSHSFTTRLGKSGRGNRDKANNAEVRELEVPLTKPIRLGRIDPREGVYPDIDLTADLAMEHGVSREHACIFRRGDVVEVEDLASTNGTRLNGTRLAPYLPVPLKHGDQLLLGRLLIEVCFGANQRRTTTTRTRLARATAH
jgi:hypothetical protein